VHEGSVLPRCQEFEQGEPGLVGSQAGSIMLISLLSTKSLESPPRVSPSPSRGRPPRNGDSLKGYEDTVLKTNELIAEAR
jgi:hypothetical protein